MDVSSRGMTGRFALVALGVAALLAVPAAASATTPHTQGASVLSSTRVKIVFSTPVTAATQLSHYSIRWASGSLRVRGATLANSGNAVVLRTALQRNARRYDVRVSGVVSAGTGTPMAATETEVFRGTSLGGSSPAACTMTSTVHPA